MALGSVEHSGAVSGATSDGAVPGAPSGAVSSARSDAVPGTLTGSPTMQQSGACGYRGDGDGLMGSVLKRFGADGIGTQAVRGGKFIEDSCSGPKLRGG